MGRRSTRLTAILLGAPQDDESEDEWIARVKQAVKKEILESYRNGQKAGLKPEKKERQESRPAKKFWPRRRKEER